MKSSDIEMLIFEYGEAAHMAYVGDSGELSDAYERQFGKRIMYTDRCKYREKMRKISNKIMKEIKE